MLKFLMKLFNVAPSATLEEIYLGQSGSLVELERRQKEIERGQAPWQVASKGYYK